MDIWTTLAHEIIDDVEDYIRKFHPEVEQHVKDCHYEDEDGNFMNTLLYGDEYDEVEYHVARLLQEFFEIVRPKG